MFESALHRRVVLALALAALALSGASAGAVADAPARTADASGSQPPVDTDNLAAPTETSNSVAAADETTDGNVSATVVTDGDRLALHSAPNQTVRLRTNAEPGTTLQVVLRESGNLHVIAEDTVSEDGTAAVAFDLSDFEVGTDVRVVVRHDQATVGSASGVVAEAATEIVTEGERLVVRAAPNQTVRVRTNATPGADVTVRLRSPEAHFLETSTATVTNDGTATATFDLRHASAGTSFTAHTVRDDTSVEGVVVEESATVHRDATFALSEPTSNYTVRGRMLDDATELDVGIAADGWTASETVTVGDDGRFTASFDASSVPTDTEVSVDVGGIPRSTDAVVATDGTGDATVYAFAETPANATLRSSNGTLLVHAAPDQTVRGSTNLRPGTELTVTAVRDERNDPDSFERTANVTVGANGGFAAALNLTGVEPGTNFSITVGPGLAAADGRVVNQSVEIPAVTTTATPTTSIPTTAIPTTYDESGFPFTTTEIVTTTPTTIAGDSTEGLADDDFGVPGFGVPAALAGLVAALALARRARA